jgi:hypothetical protein
LFSFIALPHRYDAPSLAAWRPNHHDHSPGEISNGLHSDFAVVAPPVFDIERAAGEDVPRIGEVNRPLGKRLGALRAIKRDPHTNYRTGEIIIVHPEKKGAELKPPPQRAVARRRYPWKPPWPLVRFPRCLATVAERDRNRAQRPLFRGSARAARLRGCGPA